MQSQAMVTFEAVCDQPFGGLEIRDVGDFTELGTASLFKENEGADMAVGEPGAGDAVELRELLRGEPLVGESSGRGNSRGCWRVETMMVDDVCSVRMRNPWKDVETQLKSVFPRRFCCCCCDVCELWRGGTGLRPAVQR